MPTIIDSLVVQLSLDAKNFTTGQKQAEAALKTTKDAAGTTGVALKTTSDNARRTAIDMQASGKVAGEYFSTIKNQALGLMAVLIGGKGIEALVVNTTTKLAEMGRASLNIGVSVPELAAFRNAVAANGGSAEAAAGSFQHLADEMARLKATGTNSIMTGLQAIGAGPNDNAMETVRKYARYVDAHPNDRMHNRFVGQQLGLDEGSINTVLKGSTSLSRDLAAARERGLPTKEMTDNAGALAGAFHGTEQAAGHLTDLLVNGLSPGLTKFLNTLTPLIRVLSKFLEANPEAATALGVGLSAAGILKGPAALRWGLRTIFGGAAAGGAAAGGAAAGGAAEVATGAGAALAGRAAVGGLVGGGVIGAGLLAAVAAVLVYFGFRIGSTATGEQEREHMRGNGGPRGGPLPAGPRESSPSVTGSGTGPRGIRNNNPLNLEYRPDQGASGTDGRFGVYPAMEGGVAASARQLQRYGSHYGLTTINSIIGRWAPAGENNVNAYALSVSKSMGVGANAQLDLNDPGVMSALIGAMAKVENGRAVDPDVIRRGVDQVIKPGGASYKGLTREEVGGLPRGAALSLLNAARPGAQLAHNDNAGTQTVHVNGPITIHTQAKDGREVAQVLRRELSGRRLATQANSGLA